MIFLTKPAFFDTVIKASELIKNEEKSSPDLSGMPVAKLRNQEERQKHHQIRSAKVLQQMQEAYLAQGRQVGGYHG